MSGYEIAHHHPSSTVDVTLHGVTLLSATSTGEDPVLDSVTVGMSRSMFDSLAVGMAESGRRGQGSASIGARNVGGMLSEFERAKRRYASGTRSYSPLEAEALKVVEGLERAALSAIYDENEQGGRARHVVAQVASALGVDIDEGSGHRWDPDHMERVADGARRLKDDRDHWQQEAENQQKDVELWKSLAQRQDNTAPLRMELDSVKRERDEWRSRYEGAKANAEYVRAQYGHPDEVEELREAVVRQAREISRLTEESE